MTNTTHPSDQLTEKHRPLRILVVGAHPADSFDNAGGTCLHHARQGDQITAFILTGGSRIHDEVITDHMERQKKVPPEDVLRKLMQERIKYKQGEVLEACAIMGINDVRFSIHDEGVFLMKEEVIREISSLIRELRPHIIITHYPFDHGGIADHHAITGQTVLNAIWSSAMVEPGDPNPPWKITQAFFFGFPSTFTRTNAMIAQFAPMYDVFVDISDVIELKREALDKMRSQKYDGLAAIKRIETVEGSAGFACKTPYAEAFVSYRATLHYTLPLSDLHIERAQENETDTMHRISYLAATHGTLDDFQKVKSTHKSTY